MENKFLEQFNRTMDIALSDKTTLEGQLDDILPRVKKWGQDLWEEKSYIGKPWQEIRDDDTFQDIILHVFNADGEYIRSIDGNIKTGKWRYLKESNKFIISLKDDNELFDLAFLNDQFFILSKHGDQPRKGNRKYFTLLHEKTAKKVEWLEAMEILFDVYRKSSMSYIMLSIAVVLIILIILIIR